MNAYLHYYYYARPFFYVPTPQGRAPTNITCFYKTSKHNRASAQKGENNNGLKSRWIFAAFSMAINTLSGIVPMRFLILFLSIVLIWFGITVTVSANSLLILFDIIPSLTDK
jgi:hypothetical protein